MEYVCLYVCMYVCAAQVCDDDDDARTAQVCGICMYACVCMCVVYVCVLCVYVCVSEENLDRTLQESKTLTARAAQVCVMMMMMCDDDDDYARAQVCRYVCMYVVYVCMYVCGVCMRVSEENLERALQESKTLTARAVQVCVCVCDDDDDDAV